jgi:hypothetical protein
MNIHMNELYLSCENDVCDIFHLHTLQILFGLTKFQPHLAIFNI